MQIMYNKPLKNVCCLVLLFIIIILSIFISDLLSSLNFYLKVKTVYLKPSLQRISILCMECKDHIFCEPNCLLQHKQKMNCSCYVLFVKHVKIGYCFDERHTGGKRSSLYFVSLPLLDYLGRLSLNLWRCWEPFEKFPLARPSLGSRAQFHYFSWILLVQAAYPAA